PHIGPRSGVSKRGGRPRFSQLPLGPHGLLHGLLWLSLVPDLHPGGTPAAPLAPAGFVWRNRASDRRCTSLSRRVLDERCGRRMPPGRGRADRRDRPVFSIVRRTRKAARGGADGWGGNSIREKFFIWPTRSGHFSEGKRRPQP